MLRRRALGACGCAVGLHTDRASQVRIFRDEEEVDDLEDARRIHDEEDDEPRKLLAARRSPERKTFPYEAPEHECE